MSTQEQDNDGQTAQTEGEQPEAFDWQNFIKPLTQKPGVYRMINAQQQVLYVGKAKNLKKRVSSYFQKKDNSPKTRSMVSHIASIEVTITQSESEALLLENNLIKEYKPRYNILLRDDKSYPYIYLTAKEDFPRLCFHRGARSGKGEYFGPYPSASSVRESLGLLQKIFKVRQCEDNFFKNRTRPCLQYQIKRCTGPCVDMVSKQDYEEDIRHAVMFLQGKNSSVIDELVRLMEQAAEQQKYEKAAVYRDQITSLRRVQEKQYISADDGNVDVIACVEKNGVGCVQVFFIRGGHNLGNKTFFPKQTKHTQAQQILEAFLPQYYLKKSMMAALPHEILLNIEIDDSETLTNVLSDHADRKVTIKHRVREQRAKWLAMAETNANNALAHQLANKTHLLQRFEALQDALQLDSLPQRLECYDISHTMGESTVASCVVMELEGLVKSDYRRFNIDNITPGDDYAAMKQALMRRYTKLKQGEGKMPDILIIDGGKGQLSQAELVLTELQINDVLLLGVAKGPDRKPGLESLFLSSKQSPFILPDSSPALHLIQQIRDEAHRFAITTHRTKRSKTRNTSVLEGIEGMGPKRRQQLLRQFGGLQQLSRASLEEIAKVSGISMALAKRIYETLHTDD